MGDPPLGGRHTAYLRCFGKRRHAEEVSIVERRLEQHARLLASDETYAELAAKMAVRCLGSGRW